jgi:hypothetical protein
MLYDVEFSGTKSLRAELFGLSDSCGAHSQYTVLDDPSPINCKNLRNKNTLKLADMNAGFTIEKYVGGRFLKESINTKAHEVGKCVVVSSERG